MIIKPFRIFVSNEVLADLKSRLQRTRWPEAELVDDWSQGTPLKWIKEVCQYWAEGYDWRSREALLNRFAQFTTEIDGLDMHFLHVRSPHPEAMPLIITHGWPGSVVEFLTPFTLFARRYPALAFPPSQRLSAGASSVSRLPGLR
jgi:hypothetical protein